MAWSGLTWKILRIFQSRFLSGEVCAETRHSSYTKRYLQAEKNENTSSHKSSNYSNLPFKLWNELDRRNEK